MNLQLEIPQTAIDLAPAEPVAHPEVVHDILLDSALHPDLYTERWQVPLGGE